jgi:hypothetical protein
MCDRVLLSGQALGGLATQLWEPILLRIISRLAGEGPHESGSWGADGADKYHSLEIVDGNRRADF